MADYIERSCIPYVKMDVEERCHNDRWTEHITVAYKKDIDKIPACDVAQVVRCKDCKHGTRLVCDLLGNEGIQCRHGNIAHRLDWFCADGEKMDKEVNT